MESKLINKQYLTREKSIFLEQYKIITVSADKITEKRQDANKFYLSANSIVLGVIGYLTTLPLYEIALLFSVVGFLISLVWWQNIKSFKRLNSAKFRVIHEMEDYLPARIYKQEDLYLKEGYYKLTSVEKYMPLIFAGLYMLIVFGISFFFIYSFFIS